MPAPSDKPKLFALYAIPERSTKSILKGTYPTKEEAEANGRRIVADKTSRIASFDVRSFTED